MCVRDEGERESERNWKWNENGKEQKNPLRKWTKQRWKNNKNGEAWVYYGSKLASLTNIIWDANDICFIRSCNTFQFDPAVIFPWNKSTSYGGHWTVDTMGFLRSSKWLLMTRPYSQHPHVPIMQYYLNSLPHSVFCSIYSKNFEQFFLGFYITVVIPQNHIF